METFARLAKPGMLAQTRPRLSAIANMVIQTILVGAGSHHTVLSVIDENSFVKVILICLWTFLSS
jgi:hypothetical protein